MACADIKGPGDDSEIPNDEKINPGIVRDYLIGELGIHVGNIKMDDTVPPEGVIFKHVMLKHNGLAVVDYSTHSGIVHRMDFDLSGGAHIRSWIGSRVVRVLVFALLSLSFLVSSIANVRPVNAAALDSSSVPTITNMASAGQLYKVVDKMWEDPDIAGILSQYEATDKPHKVQAMADLSLDYFSKIPPDIVGEYKEYAKMAGLPETAWVVFAALELTETSGAQIVDPGNLDKLVNQQDGGMGPLQVMKAQCLAVNKYMDFIRKAIDEGKMKSIVDKNKIAILGRFGFTYEKHIDIEKINPYSSSYDRAYACLVGAVIMALNNYVFSERYFILDDEGLQYPEDDNKYIFKRLSDPPDTDPGYDQLLATVASYNLGFNDIRDLLVEIGPWHALEHISWYKQFLVGLETKITQSHSVRFRTFITMILYMFPDNTDLREALQSLGYDVDFITMQQHAETEIESGIGQEAADPSGDNTTGTAAGEEHGSKESAQGIKTRSIFLGWPFWAGIGMVLSIWATTSAIFLKFFVSTRKTGMPDGSGEEFEDETRAFKFIEGSIYDKRFIQREKSDPRFTVVFDMDDTILWGDSRHDLFYVRPDAEDILGALKRKGRDVKIVLWTSATRSWTEKVLNKAPELAGISTP